MEIPDLQLGLSEKGVSPPGMAILIGNMSENDDYNIL
jgi:hypothetical protein